ncbi:hypothetical protein K3H40_17560 [Aeromonas veronii]|uniref:hypothetical protein n=1 Tax=Aeromonas veronii TaxID=654 RepID=UPI001F383C7A|nr:hypothetical protein [Aeromonas veronii]MCF5880860.1 hypothetical protein [Aeromonas veronii]
MPRTTKLATLLGLLLSAHVVADEREQAYFKQTYQEHYEQMTARLAALHQSAADEQNVIIKDGKRHLAINGLLYPLTADNHILFDLPKPHFFDETAIRNVFDFFDEEWELTWYDGGVVAVNKRFGNYDYGNGCLLEYFPHGQIQNGERTRVVMETSSCSVNSFATSLQYLDKGEELAADQLGLDASLITAVERYQDRLYVSQNGNPGHVAIIDIPSRQQIGEIGGTETGSATAYNQVSELFVRNNLLYVVSRYSHRVDIFDLADEHRHVTTLGTGRDSGSNSLHRAQAVFANQDYVLVADALSEIKVYRQQDVTPENSLKTPIAGRLAFEGKYSHRLVQLHQVGDYLLAHTAGKNYYIYDLRKLADAIASNTPLAPEQVIADSNLQKIDMDGDRLVVNFKDRIEWHDADTLIANDFQFKNPTFTVREINQQPVAALKDLQLAGSVLVTANERGLGFNQLLSKEISFTADEQLPARPLIFDQLMPTAVSYILRNDEPYEVLIDRAQRSVNINSLVKTELLDNDTVRITNYAARELYDINIESRLNGINKWLILGQLDRLPAYAQIILPLSAFGEQGRFNSASRDGVFDLNNLLDNSINLPAQFEHRFSSNSDPFAQKLARLKPSWNVRFATNTSGSWRPINALYAREWLIIATNLAYMVSTEEFKHVWYNFKAVNGYEMFGNGGNSYVPNGIFTAADYDYYYHSLMKRPYLNLGITAMGGGLGSGGITGVDTFNFVSHYYGGWGIIAHEFGHGFDGKSYSHESAFARGSHGWHPLMTGMANYHIRKGDLPYLDDDLNGFHKPENDIYRYNSVSQGARKHRADSHMYYTDHYFMQFSTMPQGWVANGSDFSAGQLAALNNQERLLMGWIPKESEKGNLCRFTFQDGEQYYGYVEQRADGLLCDAGSLIRYRQPDGQFVPLVSAINQFDWLSLHHKGKLDQPVLHQNGRQLCYKNVAGFYGIGFVNDNKQCTQLPNVYQTNGKHWLTSSGWTGLTYLSGDFILPTTGSSSDFTVTDLASEYSIVNGALDFSLTLTTANPVTVTATLLQDGNPVATGSALIDGQGSLQLTQSGLAAGSYELLLAGMAEGSKQGFERRFTLTLVEQAPGGDSDGGNGSYPVYVAGTAYQSGERVSNAGGDYECKPWPYSGWCGGSTSHYAPGTGSHWSDAWTKL